MSTIEWVVLVLAIKSAIDGIMISRIFDRLINLQENAILMSEIIVSICGNKSEE